MRMSLVISELVHSVDGRRAQGRNGQQSPVVRSSEASVETRKLQKQTRDEDKNTEKL